ncbi:MAG: DUF445 family protein [Desulfobacterales bacterium]|nr:DUF445 family protein [Desulfobacterales bacterium]
MIMDFITKIIIDFKTHLWLYLSMPVIAAVIGYVTKIVAIRMMFEPIEFIGIKPYFGWQGIVPRKAKHMATIACDTMTSKLISPTEIFNRIDPKRVAQEIERPILDLTDRIAHEVMSQYQPGLWESMPERMRNIFINRIKAETPGAVAHIMENVKANLDEVFDLKDMVISNLMRDKELINSIFLESGRKEFNFIRNSGIYFGFAIGLVQMLTWILTHSTYVMPIFGGFTGWFTDWLALKMIFYPKYPTTYLGFIKWQGLFLKRRKEVASEYGALIADKILTPSAIIEAVLKGPLADNLFDMIQKHIHRVIDEQAGMLQPIVVFAVGSNKYIEMKKVVAEKMVKHLPRTLKHIEKYAGDAMDIRNTIVQKMQELSPEEFEQLIRPAFQQDEWILITVGAVLGFLVGELQVFLMTH